MFLYQHGDTTVHYKSVWLPILRRGVKAIIFIADETVRKLRDGMMRPKILKRNYDIDGGPNENVTPLFRYLWLHQSEKKNSS